MVAVSGHRFPALRSFCTCHHYLPAPAAPPHRCLPAADCVRLPAFTCRHHLLPAVRSGLPAPAAAPLYLPTYRVSSGSTAPFCTPAPPFHYHLCTCALPLRLLHFLRLGSHHRNHRRLLSHLLRFACVHCTFAAVRIPLPPAWIFWSFVLRSFYLLRSACSRSPGLHLPPFLPTRFTCTPLPPHYRVYSFQFYYSTTTCTCRSSHGSCRKFAACVCRAILQCHLPPAWIIAPAPTYCLVHRSTG